MGDTSLDEEFEATSFTLSVESITEHPDYVDGSLPNDISILPLTSPVSLTEYPNIKPVCLPAAGHLFSGDATGKPPTVTSR